MKYCRRCLLPSTKPHIVFDDEGICGACRAHDRKNLTENRIDWSARARAFDALVEEARDRKAPLYDVLVPVSGGKDFDLPGSPPTRPRTPHPRRQCRLRHQDRDWPP